jgi:hypothetical protein
LVVKLILHESHESVVSVVLCSRNLSIREPASTVVGGNIALSLAAPGAFDSSPE